MSELLSYEDVIEGVYEPSPGQTKASVQWKGTDVCIDIWCKCGAHLHFDGYFMYWLCPHCETRYACDPRINLVEIPSDLRAQLDDSAAIQKPDPDPDIVNPPKGVAH